MWISCKTGWIASAPIRPPLSTHSLTHSLTVVPSLALSLSSFLSFLSFLPDCSVVTLRGEHAEGQGRARAKEGPNERGRGRSVDNTRRAAAAVVATYE